MWTRYDLKRNAQIAFKRNYWSCVAVSLLASVLGGGFLGSFAGGMSQGVQVQHTDPSALDSYSAYSYNSGGYSGGISGILFSAVVSGVILLVSLIALVYSSLVSNVIMVGGCRYYLENREHQTNASQIFYGFQKGRYGHVVSTMLLRDVFIFLWTLLLIVPGIIKLYSYRLVPYILAENPHMNARQALRLSEQMMRGHKWDSFVLELSFLGWFLLAGFTCGLLNIFYVAPYVEATFAEFYVAIRTESIQKGLVATGELPGVGVASF